MNRRMNYRELLISVEQQHNDGLVIDVVRRNPITLELHCRHCHSEDPFEFPLSHCLIQPGLLVCEQPPHSTAPLSFDLSAMRLNQTFDSLKTNAMLCGIVCFLGVKVDDVSFWRWEKPLVQF